MSNCPHCQHELSSVDSQSNQCPACGRILELPADDPSSSAGPPAEGNRPAGQPHGDAPLTDAMQAAGNPVTGLSSASEPETWNVAGDAVTYQSEDASPADPASAENAPEPIDLTEDDIVRMSVLWGEVDDAVPSGMTIKSKESGESESDSESDVELDDEEDDKSPTLNVEELSGDEFPSDESSETFATDSEGSEDEAVSSFEKTFVSDEVPSLDSGEGSGDGESADSHADTFLSHVDPSRDSRQDTTPDDPQDESFDKTIVSDELDSKEADSEANEEVAKTLPIDDPGDWEADENGETFAGEAPGPGPRSTEESPFSNEQVHAGDSTDKTLISKDLSEDHLTDSGSADGARRTDAMASEEVSGAEAAEGSGLNIHLRSLHHRDERISEQADYQILSLLGAGGMGKVYNARQTSIDRLVAVKMLKPKKSGRRRDQHTKFLAEAVVTGELDHPNIVPIYDVGRDNNDALFYSMKKVTGNPWLDTIHQKSAHDNLEILLSVADAVAFAHARGVVHRDLKPENVMLGEFGEVLVMDWGLAMPTDRFGKQRGIVRSSSMGGTPAYMAPEMATGPITKIGPHSDIYLLGAMLFEIVTGRPPHRGKNAMKCLMSAARNKIVSTEHTGELIDVAYKAMSTDPRDRYKSVQEFQAAIRTYLAHSESITLAALAEEDLERAQESDNYQDYNKAQFGFEEALKLWAGNKRAKASLGATRLAYAHCAADKGDYDLAASLLDDGDPSHEKLRADIVKARDERNARQNRLEAAKRLGMALALLLFVVVSGAAVWINSERQAAITAKDDAVEARVEAENQKELAVIAQKKAEAAEEAERQAKLIEKGLREKAEAATEAERKARLAEQKAKNDAILAKKEAEDAAEAERKAKLAEQKAKNDAILAQKRAEAAADAERKAKLEAEQQELLATLNAMFAKDAAEAERKAKLQEQKAKDDAILARKKAEAAAEAERKAKLAEQKAKDDAILARKKAEAAAEAERKAKLAEQKAKDEAILAKKKAEAAEEQERKAKLVAIEAKINEEREAYVSKVGLAAAKIEENAFDAARDLLLSTNPRFRNWEWGHLMHLCGQSERVYPENKEGQERLEAVALIGNEKAFVVAGENGLVQIRSIENQDQVLKTIPLPANLTVWDVAVSPDGGLIALATNDDKGYIKIWDVAAERFRDARFGEPAKNFSSLEDYQDQLKNRHMATVVSVAFSSDGQKLLSASRDQTARVWRVADGAQLASLPDVNTQQNGHFGIVWDAVFCPNYKRNLDGELVRDAEGKLVPLPETKIITVGEDKTAFVWVDPSGSWSEPQSIKLLPAFTAHKNPIYSVACSPDGQYIATGGFGRRVLLWRPDELPQISERDLYDPNRTDPLPQTPYRELVGHRAPIRSLSFGSLAEPDSRDLVVLTGSDDNTLKVWSVDRMSGKDQISPLKTFRGHGGYVRDCVFNEQGTWILSIGHDKKARRWSLDDDATTEVYLVNGMPLDAHQDHVDAVDFSFANDSARVATAGRDNTAQIYERDAKNRWQRKHSVEEGHKNLIPAGVYFAGGEKLATAGFDNTARIWDVPSGTEQIKFTGTGYIGVIAVSPDGRWVLTGAHNDDPDGQRWQAKLWDAKAAEDADKPIPIEFGEHRREITAVALADDPAQAGRLLLATGDAAGRVSLWRFMPGDAKPVKLKDLIGFQDRHAHNGRISGLEFTPNGRRLISASWDTVVSQWDIAKGEPVNSLEMKHPQRIASLDLTPDGRFLVTSCFDGVVRVWNAETAELAHELKTQGRVGTLLANLPEQFAARKLTNEQLEQAWKLINPDMEYQQFLEEGGWAQDIGPLLNKIPERNERELSALVDELVKLFGVSRDDLLLPLTASASISPDGRYVVAANRVDQIVHGWLLPEAGSNAKPREFTIDDNRDTWATAFSNSGTRVDLFVLGFGDARQFLLKPTNNADDPVSITGLVKLDAQDAVAAAAFSPDGEYLVTGTEDMAARVFNVKTGRDVVKLEGRHTGAVNAAVWAPPGFAKAKNERYILTAADDRTAILWKLTKYEPQKFSKEAVQFFKGHTDRVLDAAFSPDGKWIVTVSSDQTIRIWDPQNGTEIAKTDAQGDEVLCVAVRGDGTQILTGSADNNARIWNVQTSNGKTKLSEALILVGHSARITDVAFSPLEDINGDGQFSEDAKFDLDGDGKRNESEPIGARAVTASADNTVIVWDTRIPEVLNDEIPPAKQVLALKRHNRPVNAVRFSPDGRYILTGSEDHRAILWPTVNWLDEKRVELEKTEDETEVADSNGQE